MVLLLCFLLLVVAAFFLWRGKSRGGGRLLIAAIVLILLVGCGVVPQWLLSSTQSGERASAVRWTEHNSIVMLGAGTLAPARGLTPRVPFFGFSRIASAARLYFACRARSTDCKIVVSGGDPQRHGQTEAAVYAQALLALQVPRGDLIIEDKSNNTWQNAQYSTTLVPAERTLAIVTSGFQIKRALLYFSHFRRDVVGVASDELDVEFSAIPSSMNFMIADALLHEQIGIGRYYLYNALGWNAPRTR